MSKLPLRERRHAADCLARQTVLRPATVAFNGRALYALRYLVGDGQAMTTHQLSRWIQILVDRELASYGLTPAHKTVREVLA